VYSVWLSQAFDANGPIGMQASQLLVSQLCERGGIAEDPLCV